MNLFERWNNIIYLWASGILEIVPDSHRNRYSPKARKLKLRLIAKDLVADFLRIFRNTKFEKSQVWFLALTQNNYVALKDIQERIPGSVFVSFFRFRSTINSGTLYFNLPLKFFYHLIYPFALFLYSLKNRQRAIEHYDLLLAVNGSYEECLRLLKKSRPKAILFSNDHLIIARAMLLAAKKLSIKTYYVQHASVSEYFPPLEFSYAFLEGEDALVKYKKCGQIDSEVILVGMPKFDKYINHVNNNEKLTTVGIPFNLLDDLEVINKLVEWLKAEYPNLEVIIRPHPGDQRDLSQFASYSLSDPSRENAFQFLARTDGIICADSSIHLEAALLNVYPLYYNFERGEALDYYGYVRNGLVDFCKNIDELKLKIAQLRLAKPDIRNRAAFYNAAVNSDFYGQSTNKIVDMVFETINQVDEK
ncbi:hypothetical protein D7Z94_02700 [Ulvibacterium marinum]|uniref:CDP-glycerol--glycerophosphate glycerophosphotransferase n=1 Tax=Ulvibacterium marinum TaxID=2419782 RepID=A0A3B0CDK5_9FLAO|nr:hypothetical protein D7Z94_02700 [Ulvibacterium marinum]